MESLVGEYYSWEYSLALVICFVYLFSFHYLITFRSNDAGVTRSMIGFMIMFAVFSIVNVALVRIAVFSYGMHYILAITLVGAIVSILTYVLNRKFIFQR
jgi:putative flippase GtrA